MTFPPLVGLAIGVGVAAFQGTLAYFQGASMVLRHARAREVTPEQEPRLHNIVDGIAIAAGVPKPRGDIVAGQTPEALATGRGPEESHIGGTPGLLGGIDRVELEGGI